MLHLGEVEIRTEPSPDKLTSVVEEVEGKIEDGTGDGCVVDGNSRFVEMPPSGAEEQSPEYDFRAQTVELEHTGQSKRQAFGRVYTSCRQSQSRPGDEQHRTSLLGR